MAELPRTPSPKTSTAVARNSMAVDPPQTPDGLKISMQATKTPSNSAAVAANVSPASDGLKAPSPSGQLCACTTNKDAYKTVLVHTAKCSECDKRNMDTMLRCPGCTFQICKPCLERRENSGRELTHGSMTSPNGGIFRSGGLGSGKVTRKKLASVAGSMSPSPGPSRARKAVEKNVDGDVAMGEESGDGEVVNKGKGKSEAAATPASKPASKKRGSKNKSRSAEEDDSDEEYGTESSNKRRRSTVHITDSPTSTSVRPSRRTSQINYTMHSSPESSTTQSEPSPTNRVSSERTQVHTESSPPNCESSNGTQAYTEPSPVSSVPSNCTQATKVNTAAKTKPVTQDLGSRIQELLEQHGVNTPQNRYQQHFLERVMPVRSNPEIHMPPARDLGFVRREQNGNGVHFNGHAPNQTNTVRALAQFEASAYIAANAFSADENNELMSAVLAAARKWANSVWEQMLSSEQKDLVQRGLDMRLDLIEAWFASGLKEKVAECATAKVTEFMAEREGMED